MPLFVLHSMTLTFDHRRAGGAHDLHEEEEVDSGDDHNLPLAKGTGR